MKGEERIVEMNDENRNVMLSLHRSLSITQMDAASQESLGSSSVVRRIIRPVYERLQLRFPLWTLCECLTHVSSFTQHNVINNVPSRSRTKGRTIRKVMGGGGGMGKKPKKNSCKGKC